MAMRPRPSLGTDDLNTEKILIRNVYIIILRGAGIWPILPELELGLILIRTQMAQKPALRAGVYARALSASQNAKRTGPWIGARCD